LSKGNIPSGFSVVVVVELVFVSTTSSSVVIVVDSKRFLKIKDEF
jgi:hypothetical protein